MSCQNLVRLPDMEFPESIVSGLQTFAIDRQMDRCTDITKVIGTYLQLFEADPLETVVWCNQTVIRILHVRGREKPSL